MNLWSLLCLVLFLFGLYLAIYLWALKKEIRNMKKELILTKQTAYNRQITISLFDKDLSMMATELNKNLDYQKQLKFESEQTRRQMKQSVSDIAHDLRTPLTVIKGNLQMLNKEEYETCKGQDYLRICMEKIEILKTMVDDFFELSILESDDISVELKEIDVTKVLMQFLVDNEAVICECALTPEIHIPPKSVFILAEEQMLLRMLGNVLNNIMKYACDSFCVRLEMMEQGKKCSVQFSNVLDEEQSLDVEHLFERSYRGDKARQGTGAGLGLYIVKLLAEKQGAKVKAKCDGKRLLIDLIFVMS